MNALAPYKRLTIKIGSALLVDKQGRLREQWLMDLADDIAAIKATGAEIVIVSSGAIALGRSLLGLSATTLTLEQSQAAASAGQIALSQAWAQALGHHGIMTGQILITPNITEERRYYLNARTTIATLIGLGAIPIINENDSVATAEIRYGDNDRLSARVATMIEADCLILLSDIDGLYTAPPTKNPAAVHIPQVKTVTSAIEAMAGGAASHLSRGGMTTKIEAGKIATMAGTAMIIAKGIESHPLASLINGGRHTLFYPVQSRAQARKRWIMGSLTVSGNVVIDAGAAHALATGKSLLPIGVTHITGEFERGDTLAILSSDGVELARGLSSFDSQEARLIMGKRTSAVIALLGTSNRGALIHRDNLVLTGPLEKTNALD